MIWFYTFLYLFVGYCVYLFMVWDDLHVEFGWINKREHDPNPIGYLIATVLLWWLPLTFIISHYYESVSNKIITLFSKIGRSITIVADKPALWIYNLTNGKKPVQSETQTEETPAPTNG